MVAGAVNSQRTSEISPQIEDESMFGFNGHIRLDPNVAKSLKESFRNQHTSGRVNHDDDAYSSHILTDYYIMSM